jgi:galactokinase
MPHAKATLAALDSSAARSALSRLYGSQPARLQHQLKRYSNLVSQFDSIFPARKNIGLFSAPGRTEVGGNHTDHNAGRVLAAAVDLDLIAVASRNERGEVSIYSEGYPPDTIRLSNLSALEEEKYTFASVVRGIVARFRQLGFAAGGFDACITSEVPKGSGLSSSAAFEMLVARILNHIYNDDIVDEITLAKVGQFAENHYFGKPSGLMDQTTSAVGGFVTIDFGDAENPLVEKVSFDFARSGLDLVIVDTGSSHADLNDEYAAAANEMRAVAGALGQTVMRQVSETELLANLPYLRKQVSDRAILRAFHFLDDNQRVLDQVKALQKNDTAKFLRLVIASGRSSWMLLQNCYTNKDPSSQGIPLALAVSERILKGRGAWRVHGGGFAGTIQAFVPHERVEKYVQQMKVLFGEHACHILSIRPAGAVWLNIA